MKGTHLIMIAAILLTLATAISAEEEQDEQISVIIKLKDSNSIKNLGAMTEKKQLEIKTQILEKRNDFLEKTGKEKITVKNTMATQNVFSAEINLETYNELKKNSEIEYVIENIPVKTTLETSTSIINATKSWNIKQNGINITGTGETVCVIDTGIDYTHAAFGSCQNLSLIPSGTTESQITESIHNYTNNYDNTTTITKSGYTSIAIHFKNISTETGYDYIYILDAQGNTVQVYTGNRTEFWTPSIQGDTIKIRITSDGSVTGYGYYSDELLNGTTQRNCQKIIGGYDYVNNDDNPIDDNGHGTHVAGIVASESTPKGVAPGANLAILKALDAAGDGDSLTITTAMEWCILNRQAYNISTISMSIGSESAYTQKCDSLVPITTDMINAATRNNISVVIATGNEYNYTAISFPACIENATKVTATDDNDNFASFANRGGLFTDILTAPGVNINSASNGGGFVQESGTSMSTPHVSGGIALMKQYKRLQNQSALTVQQIKNILNNTGKATYDSESEKNYSRIEIYRAISNLDQVNPNISLAANDTSLEWQARNIIINWTSQDNIEISTTKLNITFPNGTIIYNTNRTSGNLSLNSSNLTSSGIYTAILFANDTNNNIQSSTLTFNVSSSAPQITQRQPDSETVTIRKNRTIQINISVHNPLGGIMNYTWLINGLPNATTQNHTFNTTNFETESYNITVVVNNSESSTSSYWNITVLNQNINISFNQSNPIQNISWTKGANSTNSVNLSNHFLNQDGDAVLYSLINSTAITMAVSNGMASFIVPNTTYMGTEHVWMEANDTESNSTSNIFTLQVNEPVEEEEDENEGSGGRSNRPSGGAPGSLNFFSSTITTAEQEILIKNKVNEKLAIQELNISLRKNIKDAKIKVIQHTLKDEPAEILNLVDNIIKYASITIEHTHISEEDVNNVTIKFLVNKSWVSQNKIEKNSIILYRYENNELKKLQTNYLDSDKENYEYSALSPGLSLFVIGSDNITQETEEQYIPIEKPKDKNESIPLKIQEKNTKNQTGETKMNYTQGMIFVKIGAAIISVVAILLVITLIDKMARKKAEEQHKKYLEEEKEKKNKTR